MKIKPLSKSETQWLEDFQAFLRRCPSTRFGCYTTGDAELAIYDKLAFKVARDADEAERSRIRDDVIIHDHYSTVLFRLEMPFQVDGVCG